MALSKRAKRAPQKISWPALPGYLVGVNGPIDVEISREALERGHLGRANLESRKIRIDGSLKPHVAWHTLFHEMVEMAIMDAGLHNLTTNSKKLHNFKEAVCDAIGSAMLAQFRHDNGLQ